MVYSEKFNGFEHYEIEIKEIKQELKTLPTGFLVKRGAQYYKKTGSTQTGITKDHQKIKQLARKAYLSRRLKHLEWNYSLAKKQSGLYKTEDPLEIIRGLPSTYQMMPDAYFFHPSVHENFERIIVGNVCYPDGLIYLTDSGISVRSKSERIIANALDQNGITYRYEAVLELDGVNKCPDFTIIRPFDGKVIIWEHLGLIDQDKYRQQAIEKIALYVQCGFFPADNLICTYEQDLRNPAYLQKLIKLFILS